jgi:hypothetical protein
MEKRKTGQGLAAHVHATSRTTSSAPKQSLELVVCCHIFNFINDFIFTKEKRREEKKRHTCLFPGFV